MNNRQPKFNEEELLAFAKSYLSEAFPNPERIDCRRLSRSGNCCLYPQMIAPSNNA